MRAAFVRQHGSLDTLSLENVADPAPAPDQVVVEIGAVAANFVDVLVIEGEYQFLPKLPFIPGKLPVGTIVAVGADVRDWKTGDRVQTLAEQGGYASKIAVPANACIRLPDKMSFTEAAAMGLAYDTAWFAMFERARAKPGESMLVLGASGGVGIAAVQLGKAYGIKVLAAISRKEKESLVREAGADALIDLSAPDLRNSLRQQVFEVTDGKGADVILDMLGDDIFDAAIRAIAWCGRMVIVGFAAGKIPALKVNYVMLKNMELSGLQISDYRKRRPDLMHKCYADIFRLFEAGKLHAPPTQTFPLDSVKEALHRLRDRRLSGRIVLLPSDSSVSRATAA